MLFKNMLLKYIIKTLYEQFKKSYFLIILIILLNILCLLFLAFYHGSEMNYKTYLKNYGHIVIKFKNTDSYILNKIVNNIITNYKDRLINVNKWNSFFSYSIIDSKFKECIIFSMKRTSFIFKNFIISKGKFPEFNEVLLPDIYQKNIKIGDKIKLRFLTNDDILNTINLSISGFFYSTSENKDIFIINNKTAKFCYGINFNTISLYLKKDVNFNDLILLNNEIQNLINNINNYKSDHIKKNNIVNQKNNNTTYNKKNNKITYSFETYKTKLKKIKKSSFLITKSIIFIFIGIIFILQFFLFLNYNLSNIENKLMDYYLFICLGAKIKKVVNIVLLNISINIFIIFIFSCFLSFLITNPINGTTINLKNSIFLSPLFGGVNKLSFYFKIIPISIMYSIFFSLNLIINYIIIKNKLKNEFIKNLMKYTTNL